MLLGFWMHHTEASLTQEFIECIDCGNTLNRRKQIVVST